MNKRININDLNKNRIKQAIDNLTRFHIDKMKVFTVNLDDDLDIVLQLIEKQQAEIETLKQIISKTSVQFINDTIETDKKNKEDLEMLYRGCQEEIETLKRDFEIVDHECSRLEKEDIKKDLIINEMAEYISGLDVDEDICKNIDCDENTNIYTGDINCKQCIKQYFERKIEQC